MPYLNARTTNVHTAIVLDFLDELINNQSVNQRVIALALILHDSGWSQLSDVEIAASLGVTGLKLTNSALAPKEKHALESVKIAQKLLADFHFSPSLTKQEQKLILDAVCYHDQPEKVSQNGRIPLEVQLVVDLDHLWSFTKENFWQDTVRKGIEPIQYLANLATDLDSYFVTSEGKAKARQLLGERKLEVSQLK